jgi:hypothetical protein
MAIPVPEPDLTPMEMIRRADALSPALRARQETTQAAGNIVLRGHLAHQSDTSAINFGRAYFGLDPIGVC